MPKAHKGAPTKAQTLSDVAEKSGLSKSDVGKVLDALEHCMVASLKKHGSFKLNGLLNVKVKSTPAKKARQGMNNLTGKMTTFKAKPASRTVRASALKKLKDHVK
jgi:DNA-binding protein HU-beta